MRPPLRVRLSPGQVAALERLYRRTGKPAERTRSHIMLLSHQGYIPPVIATIVRVDPATVPDAFVRRLMSWSCVAQHRHVEQVRTAVELLSGRWRGQVGAVGPANKPLRLTGFTGG